MAKRTVNTKHQITYRGDNRTWVMATRYEGGIYIISGTNGTPDLTKPQAKYLAQKMLSWCD